MEQDERMTLIENSDIRESLIQIKKYLETDFNDLTKQLIERECDIKTLKEKLERAEHLIEGNRQLINKLLGNLSKLQNDIDWYKRTYEHRSFLGTIREKLFKK